VCLYFHPWEFIDLKDYNIPAYTKRLAGEKLQERLRKLTIDMQPYDESISMQKIYCATS
jgi:hypothetical protein